MKPKKSTVLCCALALAIILLTACNFSTNKSYTFDVETGDKIKVALDTSSGLSLSQKDGQFSVTEDDENILQCIFITEETYNQYVKIKGQQGMTVLEESKKDGNPYYMYEFEGEAGTEDNFILWVDDSNTGVILASLAGEEKAKKAFEKLVISKE